MDIPPTRPALPYIYMLCGSVAFACMGALTHSLREEYDWQVILMARAALPLLFASGMVLAARVQFVLWRPWTLWLRSISGSLSMVCMFYALPRLPVADVFTLNNMFPIWVALLAWPVLSEPPSAAVWLAVASGVGGVVLIQQPHIASGNLAVVAAIGSSFLTALALIGLHRLKALDPRAIVAHFSGVALLVCALSFFVIERDDLPCRLGGWTALLLLGVGVTATIGQLFLTRALAAGAPAKVSVVGLTQIVFSMFLDGLFFSRTYDLLTLAGMALIVVPTGWLMLRAGTAHVSSEVTVVE